MKHTNWITHKANNDEVTAILVAIEAEVKGAEEKFPGWPADILHAMCVVNEEAGEATQAALDCVYKDGDREDRLNNLCNELVQTGAMVVRMLTFIQRHR